MGRVIKPDTTEGGSTAALTETGKGGLLSKGYLRDDPAGEYVGDGETPVFVVTNADEGVVRDDSEKRREITPGDGYRTIGVVTDRRVIVLVGDANDGDERVTLPLVEVTDADAEDGALIVEMRSGETWYVHAGDGAVGEVAEFVRRAATTWDELEGRLDAVKRQLVSATAHRDGGEYEAGIEDAQAAYDDLEAAVDLVDEFAEDWTATALRERVDAVCDRCVRTLADVRVGHGRALADQAETEWREDAYESAHDTYDRARAEFEAVGALDADRHEKERAVEGGLDRIDRSTEELQEVPLQRAIEADRRAKDADDVTEKVADWRLARERYLTALTLDEGVPERRFAGDPEKIRERIGTVTDRVIALATDDGAEAFAAGKWYLEADRPGVAHEELSVARDVFEEAIAVARDAEADEVEELEEWIEDAEELHERAADAADVDPSEAEADAKDAIDDAHEDVVDEEPPEEEAETDGDEDDLEIPEPAETESEDEETSPAEPATADQPDASADPEPIASDGAGASKSTPPTDSSLERRLRALDPEGFEELARSIVDSMGWESIEARDDALYDLRATREDHGGDAVVVRTVHRPVAGPVDADQVEAAAALHDGTAAEEVMVVTSSAVTDDAAEAAREEDVRLIDREYIGQVIEGEETADLLQRVRPRPDQ